MMISTRSGVALVLSYFCAKYGKLAFSVIAPELGMD